MQVFDLLLLHVVQLSLPLLLGRSVLSVFLLDLLKLILDALEKLVRIQQE